MTPLDVLRSLEGQVAWAGGHNEAIQGTGGWLDQIAQAWPSVPGLASYCAGLKRIYFPWCGVTEAYAHTKAGIQPPFDPADKDDVRKFGYAFAWKDWGTAVTGSAQEGDLAVFDFGGGDHHVTTILRRDGDHYVCLNGNQGHAVKESNYPVSQCVAVRRAIQAQPAQNNASAANVVKSAPTGPSRFDACIPYVLKDEGGNDDDPRDPGGRTSRGILQREWDVWRQSHPGLPSDVWQAPQDQVLAIYRANYWDALRCDQLPAGIDYAVFDYGVNSGNSRSAKALQTIVGTGVDGEVGPLTIVATAQADAATVIQKLCDQRLAFLQNLKTWPTFGRGWSNRVAGVRKNALAMIGHTEPTMPDQTIPTPQIPAVIVPPVSNSGIGSFIDFDGFVRHQLDAILADLQQHPAHVFQLMMGQAVIGIVPINQPTPPAPDPVPVPAPAVPASGTFNFGLPNIAVGSGIMTGVLGQLLQAAGTVSTGSPTSDLINTVAAALAGFGGLGHVSNLVQAVAPVLPTLIQALAKGAIAAAPK